MEEYLRPSLQGFRLREGEYVPIEPVEGRLPSEELGLSMERDGAFLRLYDPVTGKRLLTSREERDVAQAARQQAEAAAEAAKQQAEAAKRQSEIDRLHLAEALRQSETARLAAEREREKLQVELDELRRRSKGGS